MQLDPTTLARYLAQLAGAPVQIAAIESLGGDRSGVAALKAFGYGKPLRIEYRVGARQQIARFGEVYLRCPLEVCRARHPKGIYAGAAAGAITTLLGVGSSYEPPLAPEALVDTATRSPTAAAELVVQQLRAVPGLLP